MNRIKELRLYKNMTQQDLANFLNVTPKAISFYELGQRDIPNATLQKLADHFHVSTDFLLGRTDTTIEGEIAKYNINKTFSAPSIGATVGAAFPLVGALVKVFSMLTPDNRDKVKEYAEMLAMKQEKQ